MSFQKSTVGQDKNPIKNENENMLISHRDVYQGKITMQNTSEAISLHSSYDSQDNNRWQSLKEHTSIYNSSIYQELPTSITNDHTSIHNSNVCQEFPNKCLSEKIDNYDAIPEELPVKSLNSCKNDKLLLMGNARKFVCDVCSKCFRLSESLKKHMKFHASNTERPYFCEVCKISFRTKKDLYYHHRTHNKTLSCEICEKKFSLKRHLICHMRKHTGEKPYTCKICNSSFAGKGQLKNHSVLHSEERPYACDVCQLSFNHPYKLTVHNLSHLKPFACEICDKKFPILSKLKSHMDCHSEKIHKCNECGIGFARKKDRMRHQHIHSKTKPYSCERCSKSFHHNYRFKQHNCTFKPSEHVCEICVKKFPTQSKLKSHMDCHSEKTHKCNVCEMGFARKTDRIRHQLIHSKTKPYSCERCSKSFYHNYKLKTHNCIMNPSRNPCEICDKKFPTYYMLKSHMLCHSDKLYKCNECEKGFATKKHLMGHQQYHLKVKPYTCETCSKLFYFRYDFKNHKCPELPKRNSTDNLSTNNTNSRYIDDQGLPEHRTCSPATKNMAHSIHINVPNIVNEESHLLINLADPVLPEQSTCVPATKDKFHSEEHSLISSEESYSKTSMIDQVLPEQFICISSQARASPVMLSRTVLPASKDMVYSDCLTVTSNTVHDGFHLGRSTMDQVMPEQPTFMASEANSTPIMLNRTVLKATKDIVSFDQHSVTSNILSEEPLSKISLMDRVLSEHSTCISPQVNIFPSSVMLSGTVLPTTDIVYADQYRNTLKEQQKTSIMDQVFSEQHICMSSQANPSPAILNKTVLKATKDIDNFDQHSVTSNMLREDSHSKSNRIDQVLPEQPTCMSLQAKVSPLLLSRAVLPASKDIVNSDKYSVAPNTLSEPPISKISMIDEVFTDQPTCFSSEGKPSPVLSNRKFLPAAKDIGHSDQHSLSLNTLNKETNSKTSAMDAVLPEQPAFINSQSGKSPRNRRVLSASKGIVHSNKFSIVSNMVSERSRSVTSMVFKVSVKRHPCMTSYVRHSPMRTNKIVPFATKDKVLSDQYTVSSNTLSKESHCKANIMDHVLPENPCTASYAIPLHFTQNQVNSPASKDIVNCDKLSVSSSMVNEKSHSKTSMMGKVLPYNFLTQPSCTDSENRLLPATQNKLILPNSKEIVHCDTLGITSNSVIENSHSVDQVLPEQAPCIDIEASRLPTQGISPIRKETIDCDQNSLPSNALDIQASLLPTQVISPIKKETIDCDQNSFPSNALNEDAHLLTVNPILPDQSCCMGSKVGTLSMKISSIVSLTTNEIVQADQSNTKVNVSIDKFDTSSKNLPNFCDICHKVFFEINVFRKHLLEHSINEKVVDTDNVAVKKESVSYAVIHSKDEPS